MSLKTEIPSHCILEIDIVSFNVLSPFLKAEQRKKGKDTVTVTVKAKAKEVERRYGMEVVVRFQCNIVVIGDSITLNHCQCSFSPLPLVLTLRQSAFSVILSECFLSFNFRRFPLEQR